eukprot:SAG11_NODE_1524_length_4746_cov_5.271358_5_plen_152_part_00
MSYRKGTAHIGGKNTHRQAFSTPRFTGWARDRDCRWRAHQRNGWYCCVIMRCDCDCPVRTSHICNTHSNTPKTHRRVASHHWQSAAQHLQLIDASRSRRFYLLATPNDRLWLSPIFGVASLRRRDVYAPAGAGLRSKMPSMSNTGMDQLSR